MKIKYSVLIIGAFFIFANTVHASDSENHYRSNTDFALSGSLAPMAFPFPLGYGISGQYVMNQNWVLEGEYFKSGYAIKIFGFEISEVVEQKYTLQLRYFPSDKGSFNFIMGTGYRDLQVRLPADLFDLATHNYSDTAAELDAYFIKLGLANQWHWGKRYLFTLEWISVEVPVSANVVESASKYAEDDNDKEDIEDAEHVLKWYPSGAVLKTGISITF